MQVHTILDLIDLGSIALPEFQRGYVWNRDQVRGLMQSLYRKHPVGGLLVWVTKTEGVSARGGANEAAGTIELLLDGQQRITSLYGIIRGKPPRFFEGNAQAFTGLYFNLQEETFEFFLPLKMKGNPLWIDVTELMKGGVGSAIQRVFNVPELQPKANDYINRLNAINDITKVEFYIDKVTGEDKTVDVVVDIFNRVNSGGTKLSKGDLALARVCASWPDARAELNTRLDKWRKAGYSFRLEWLLRNVNAVATGEALFSALKDIDTPTFRDALLKAEKSIDGLLDMIASRLGLDHDRVLGGPACFPVMACYLVQRSGTLTDHKERDKLLYWYVHTFLWGRYAGATETVLNQDLGQIEVVDGGGLDRLIELLRNSRGDLRVRANDFTGWSQGARFYPLLYLLTRVCRSRDWGSGVELSQHLLGYLSSLQIHHVFPKGLLYKYGHSRPEVNALANFTFLTQQTNLAISDRDPTEYLAEVAALQPGALESHWIPTDPELWKVENYRDFLAARRELLAKAANDFLDSLVSGGVPESPAAPSVLERNATAPVPGGFLDEREEVILREINAWVVSHALPEGELLYELPDPGTGNALAVLDVAWPDGLQEGYSQPVALLLDEGSETEEAANRMGFRFFTNVNDFRRYVWQEVLAMDEDGTAGV